MGTILRLAVPPIAGRLARHRVGAEENAADQIKHYQQFTVNIPDENLMLGDGAGWFYQPSGELKYLGLDYEISERTQGNRF